MGVMVTFESRRMLLQREDFPAALKAVKRIAKDVPGFFRETKGVLAAKNLASALSIGEFPATFDASGDLIGIVYTGDKFPPGGPDDFPEHLIFGWKKLLRDTRFELWIEGMNQRRLFSVDRGVVRSHLRDPEIRRFEQLGPPPRIRPGESATVAFRYVSGIDADDTEIDVKISDANGPVAVEPAALTIRPGGETTVTIRVRENFSFYPEGAVGPALYGDRGNVRVRDSLAVIADIPEDLDVVHEVVATESTAWSLGRTGIYLHAKKHAAALEDAHRYAARWASAPGGAFLMRVAEATDIGTALRAAGFEPTFDGGHLRSFALASNRLAGSERHVVGLLRSYAGLTEARSPFYRMAYASTPEWWTTLAFDPGGVRRAHEPRRVG